MASLGLTQRLCSLSRLYMDPQSVSTFKPTRYNVAYPLTPASPNVVLIGMKRGEVLMFVLKCYRNAIDVVKKLKRASSATILLESCLPRMRQYYSTDRPFNIPRIYHVGNS